MIVSTIGGVMKEPDEGKVKNAKLKKEIERTKAIVSEIRQELLSKDKMTRQELVAFLRKKATGIHADMILEREQLK